MHSAELVFKAILDRSEQKNIAITHLKLQKLAYYCQGYHLAFYDSECFSNNIEAWEHGPVIRSEYGHYAKYNDSVIQESVSGFFDHLNSNAQRTIDFVLDTLGNYTGWALRNMSHEEAPWIDVFTPGEKNVIGKEKIKGYFLTKIEHEMNAECASMMERMEDTDVVVVPKSISSEDEFLAWLHS